MVTYQVCKFFKGIDLFGVPVGLVMDKQTHYKSLFGSFFSILGVAFICAFFWQNLLSFINKDKSIYSIDKKYSQSPDMMQINENNFMFALGFEQPKQDFTIYPFFNITVVQTNYVMEGETRKKEFIPIDMVPCTEQHFQLMGSEKYKKVAILNSRNFLCPKLDQKMVIQGLYTSEKFSFLKIVVTKCDPNFKKYDKRSWKPIDCATQTDYDAFIKQNPRPRLAFMTTNFNIIPSEKYQYSQAYIQDQQSFTFAPNFMVKSADIFITKNNINTDENILKESDGRDETYYTLNLEDIAEVSDYTTSSSSFVSLFIRRSPNTISIKRSYKKLADLMIQIGGLVKCVFLVLGFFVNKYNKFHFRLELANKLFDFSLSKDTQQKDPKKDGSSTSLDNLGEYPLTGIISENRGNQCNQLQIPPNEMTKQNDSENKKDIKRGSKSLNQQNLTIASINRITLKDIKSGLKSDVNLLEPISAGGQKSLDVLSQVQKEEQKSILINYFQQIMSKTKRIRSSISYFLNFLTLGKCFRTEQNYLIKKAQEFSKRDLDIYVILDKLQEIEKIKKVIFTPEQKTLFNFFHKPVIRKQQKLFSNKSLRDFNMQLRKSKSITQNITNQLTLPEQPSNNNRSDHLIKERDTFTTVEAYQVDI